ncbi:MAG: tRNA (adenosine(37)-N6)-dimethylallyltransferase MiaA [Bacteroidales bacterium]|nr:tRNA (adenosine(37)-N6)-dimethylallyltransferase MiaA [Bacteroidales bacterium]MBR3989149.1 tRNA (adenosine(37)-N6)-dimethylallyltransferase MiaA [Bacteroidales bacterium]
MAAVPRRLEIILGPTAVGKTGYAIRRALEVGSPVISCDSRQIFQELKIGTAAPSDEEMAAVQHYFIRSIPITRNYTAGIYEVEALELVNRLFSEGHETLVMCGGSMMYIDAFCYGLDDFPEVPVQLREHLMECLRDEGVEVLAQQLKELDPVSYEELDLSNGQRVIRALEVSLYTGKPFSSYKTRTFKERDFEIVKVGLERPREELYERINERVLRMMDEGLEAEARSMLPYRDLPALQTVGYREMFEYFDGKYDLDTTVQHIQASTRHYAKRQLTWWRRDASILWQPA